MIIRWFDEIQRLCTMKGYKKEKINKWKKIVIVGHSTSTRNDRRSKSSEIKGLVRNWQGGGEVEFYNGVRKILRPPPKIRMTFSSPYHRRDKKLQRFIFSLPVYSLCSPFQELKKLCCPPLILHPLIALANLWQVLKYICFC